MFKKITFYTLGLLFIGHLYGCALLLAGAVGGVGTAVWLSDKLVQDVNVPFDKALSASKSALKKLELTLIKETKKDDVAQLISEYYDGKNVWIDIHKMTENTARIEIRVCGVTGDEIAARNIMDKILKYL